MRAGEREDCKEGNGLPPGVWWECEPTCFWPFTAYCAGINVEVLDLGICMNIIITRTLTARMLGEAAVKGVADGGLMVNRCRCVLHLRAEYNGNRRQKAQNERKTHHCVGKLRPLLYSTQQLIIRSRSTHAEAILS